MYTPRAAAMTRSLRRTSLRAQGVLLRRGVLVASFALPFDFLGTASPFFGRHGEGSWEERYDQEGWSSHVDRRARAVDVRCISNQLLPLTWYGRH